MTGKISRRKVLLGMLAGLGIAGGVIYAPLTIREISSRGEKRREREYERSRQLLIKKEQEKAEALYDAKYGKVIVLGRDPGVILSLDDSRYIGDCHRFFTRDDIRRYNPRVTLFVYYPDRFTSKQILELKELQLMGNEIGCHGMRHRNALEYTNTYGLKSYLEAEIKPAIEVMTELDLPPTSFANPFGARNPDIDRALLDYFFVVRGTEFGLAEECEKRRTFFAMISPNERGKKFVWAYSIMKEYKSDVSSLEYVMQLIERAKEKRRIVVFYGHGIDDADYFKEIIKFVHEKGMRFYTMSELE